MPVVGEVTTNLGRAIDRGVGVEWSGVRTRNTTTVRWRGAHSRRSLLPWDQLGLWAVRVGTDIDGYSVLFGDQVRFVLIGGVEIFPSTIIRWLVVHAAVAGPVLALLIALAWRRHLRTRLAGSTPVHR